MSREMVSVLLGLVCACDGGNGDTSGSGSASGRFDVLTYNVHGLPSLITGDDTTGRMMEIGPMLDSIPLIGLQEDFTEEGHAELMAAVSHATRPWFSAEIGGRFYGSGLTILTREEMVDYGEHHYSTCHGVVDASSDCLASKGFQRARLGLGAGAEVDVYNTHLEAGGGDEDDAARAVQIDELLVSLREVSEDRAVLFFGDFNLSGEDPEDVALVELLLEGGGLQDSCDYLGCPEPGRIDRILFRSGAGVELEPIDWWIAEQFVDSKGGMLSDHNAIGGSVRWSSQSP